MDKKEEWRDILWYEWRYQVSSLGNVRSFCSRRWLLKEPRNLKLRYNKWNWSYMIYLSRTEEQLVYRLVAQAFLWLDMKDRKQYVCHKDDNRLNNCVDNLFIWTQKDNIIDCIRKWKLTQKKLSSIDLLCVRKLYWSGEKIKNISNFFNISPSHTVRIWKHYTNAMIFNY